MTDLIELTIGHLCVLFAEKKPWILNYVGTRYLILVGDSLIAGTVNVVRPWVLFDISEIELVAPNLAAKVKEIRLLQSRQCNIVVKWLF